MMDTTGEWEGLVSRDFPDSALWLLSVSLVACTQE